MFVIILDRMFLCTAISHLYIYFNVAIEGKQGIT